jgi:thioredoxin 1
MIKDSSSSKFAEDVLLAKGKVLVDFWADWCGPCKAMNPILQEVSELIDVVKINADFNSGLTAEYGLRSIPTFILFEDGKERNRIVGARPKAVFLKELGLDS